MNKSWKFIFGMSFVLILIYLFVNDYAKSLVNMEDQIGTRVGGGELSVKDNAILKTYLELYKERIVNGEYEKAYNMTGLSYKEYLPYEAYVEKVQSQNFEDLIFEDIEIATTSIYDVTFSVSGDKGHYSVLYDDEKKLYIYPDSFLSYVKVENEVTKKKLEVKLEYYVVNIDKCMLGFSIENRLNDTVEISKSQLLTNENRFVESDEKIIINPKESKKIVLEFDTDYSIPKQVILYRSTNKENEFIEYDIKIKR